MIRLSVLQFRAQAATAAVALAVLAVILAVTSPHLFWALQWAETGVFLAAAFVLAGFCFWSIRRRLSR
jgi:hypothetical protein